MLVLITTSRQLKKCQIFCKNPRIAAVILIKLSLFSEVASRPLTGRRDAGQTSSPPPNTVDNNKNECHTCVGRRGRAGAALINVNHHSHQWCTFLAIAHLVDRGRCLGCDSRGLWHRRDAWWVGIQRFSPWCSIDRLSRPVFPRTTGCCALQRLTNAMARSSEFSNLKGPWRISLPLSWNFTWVQRYSHDCFFLSPPKHLTTKLTKIFFTQPNLSKIYRERFSKEIDAHDSSLDTYNKFHSLIPS